ncbi:trace amine-associated receptor 13c-like [Erpetoichthys calabaricus]|uniref:trace amine-associated receptor 13c-like n=1 Tax=Erpetoichthys calabaricus TaxID=27687 RepID=UPI0022342BF6|nr:trace amine-associated receptor 13c-like [Erpetoichthys calabaricus]
MQDELIDHVEYFCYYPGNVSCTKAVRTPSVSLLLYILAGVLVVVTFCGNFVVIISISHFNQLHTPTNLLILSLAVADFFVGVFIMPIIIIQSIETCWYFGKLFCYIYTFFIVLLTTVSMINLAMIAIDRYIAICHPLTYSNKITVQIGATAVAAIWISSATYSGTMMLSGGNTEGVIGVDPCPGDCALVFNSTWATIDLIFSFLLPVFIMVTLYSKIFLIAKRHAKTISTQQRSSLGKNKNISKKSERKAAKTLGIVVTVFILCWLPFYVCSLLNQFMNFAVSSVVAWACLWIGYINSGLNPIIYALFYPWFRKSFKLLITCKICNPGSSLISLMSEH